MGMVDLAGELAPERRLLERSLKNLLDAQSGVPSRLKAAMKHSLLGGGKRLRPILLLWAYDAFAEERKRVPLKRASVVESACALEMLHTYSLIHDDLPAMDDDVLRRGRPTCHVAFDEATAILAGDALQALAFAILASAGGHLASEVVALVASAVGPAGMVGGQQADLDAEGLEVQSRQVARIHRLKTACLLAVALQTGALMGGASREAGSAMAAAGQDLGLAFQGADDLLDVTGTEQVLGKSPGKDFAVEKATWIRVEGMDQAGRRMNRQGRRGMRRLEDVLPVNPARERLLALGHFMWHRDR